MSSPNQDQERDNIRSLARDVITIVTRLLGSQANNKGAWSDYRVNEMAKGDHLSQYDVDIRYHRPGTAEHQVYRLCIEYNRKTRTASLIYAFLTQYGTQSLQIQFDPHAGLKPVTHRTDYNQIHLDMVAPATIRYLDSWTPYGENDTQPKRVRRALRKRGMAPWLDK